MSVPNVAIGDLSERALLVHLHISMWEGRKGNEEVSRETERQKGAENGTVKTTVQLVPKANIKPIRDMMVAGHALNRELTLPWIDKGTRILASELHPDYSARMRDLRAQFDMATATFLDQYPHLRATAPSRLNSLFKASDFPSQYELARKFEFKVRPVPFPSVRDLRLDLADSQVARLRQDMEDSISAAVAEAMRDPYDRILSTVGHMVERLTAYKPGLAGQREQGGFHDSLVGNVRDLVALLPSLNLTRDAALTAITQRMASELCVLDADVLKADESQREQTARRANEILAAVQEFIA